MLNAQIFYMQIFYMQIFYMEGNPPDAGLMWALGALLAAVASRPARAPPSP